MPRKARFAPPGYWMHILQRGHTPQPIFRLDEDRSTYLDLLSLHAQDRQVQVLGYTLMPTHIHLVALGKYPRAVSECLRAVNHHYSQHLRDRQPAEGRLWQDRFFSCTVDERYLRPVLRYVEQNPVRAGIIDHASAYAWSSAAHHIGRLRPSGLLNLEEFARRFTAAEWRLALSAPQSLAEVNVIRAATQLGQPLGTPEFLAHLEAEFDVVLSRSLLPLAAKAAGA